MHTVREIAYVVFFVWLFIDAMVVFRLKSSESENRDRQSLRLLMIGNPIAYAISIALAYGRAGAMDSVPLQVTGLVILVIGIAIRTAAIMQLGRLHTPNVAVRTDHQLKQTGLYRRIRHPSYLGALLGFLGFALALGNWWSVVVMMGITTFIYLYRIREEDAALAAAFGESYRQYAARTKRLIPWVY
ncbi:methyltransferase family protein [Dyella soli]